jgi:hypothetical protein
MLEQKMVELMTQAQQAVSKIAPEALELAIKQQFWSGCGTIGGGIIALVIFLVLLVPCIRAWKGFIAYQQENQWADPAAELFITAATGVPGIIALFQLTDTWAWVSLFDPKTALFHRIFEKLLN